MQNLCSFIHINISRSIFTVIYAHLLTKMLVPNTCLPFNVFLITFVCMTVSIYGIF
jgi:hypothetical protein